MIISASRRTDIPACHFDWFMDCLNKGSVSVPNPHNRKLIRQVDLTPEAVDAFVFWTKNPALCETVVMDPESILNQYTYYFQFTITPYGRDVEPFLPDKNEIISTFQRFSQALGAHRVIWRYDPILISSVYDVPYHIDIFEKYAAKLQGYTETCVISFLDEYRFMQKAMKKIGARAPDETEIHKLAEVMAETARKYGIRLQTCSETVDLSEMGILHGACIDGELVERLVKKPPYVQISMFPEDEQHMFARAKGLRGACRCVESIDIGKYDTCSNGCLYCYANRSAVIL